MSQQQGKKTKKPLGNNIAWSDQDLDALSAISQADIKAAAALWEAESPKPLKDLLRAKVEESSGGK